MPFQLNFHSALLTKCTLLAQITSIKQMFSSLSVRPFSLCLGQRGYWWSHRKDSFLFSTLQCRFFSFPPSFFCAASHITQSPKAFKPPCGHFRLTFVILPSGLFFFSSYEKINAWRLSSYLSLCRRLNDNEIVVLEAAGTFKKLPNLRKMYV